MWSLWFILAALMQLLSTVDPQMYLHQGRFMARLLRPRARTRTFSLDPSPAVELPQGTLLGNVFKSSLGDGHFVGFLGIPYAQPPVGSLRFKSPQGPPPSWEGNRPSKEASWCTQLFKSNLGSEDCLHLNVFTPQVSEDSEERDLLPVMFWIHGGGFAIGSGTDIFAGPDYLMREGVMVVTINYRLGAFGFLSFNDSVVPGNAGLKDQLMALQWVRDNIAYFGGDPDRVTIFGESAGAACVHYHLLSPKSKGLFHGAISESGSALSPWAFEHSTPAFSDMLAERLGCSREAGDQLECLQGLTPHVITSETVVMVLHLMDNATYYIPIGPTAEPIDSTDAFLTDDPRNLYKSGQINDVPYISGINSNEGIPLKYAVENEINFIEKKEKLVDAYIPRDLDRSKYNVEELVKEVKQFYFGEHGTMSLDKIQEFYNLTSDMMFINGHLKSFRLHSLLAKGPMYCYQFSFSGAWNFLKFLVGASSARGAGHTDELPYIFKTKFLKLGGASKNSPTQVTSRRMVKMWTNFAKTGNPTCELTEDLKVTWPPYTEANHNCLRIDKELTVMPQLEPRRSAFWEDIYRRYG